MSTPSCYEIEVRGRPSRRMLHPVVDDFRIEPTGRGTTRLVGEIRDPSHLNGLLAHLTSMNVEVVGLRCLDPDVSEPAPTNEHTHPEKGTTP